jgi:hypothetical protein
VAGSGVFRTSPRDALVLGAALVHVALLAALAATAVHLPLAAHVAVVALLGLAMNWSSNTVSHIHLHTPLFRGEAANRTFSLFLSVLLAVPQSWWKLRHLAHHGLPEATAPRLRRSLQAWGAAELGTLLALAVPFGARAPWAFATIYAPATLVGFVLCAIQGHEEHARAAAGVDVRGRIYNHLWFNDGFHAAHHRCPEAHWTILPAAVAANDVVSNLPPIARWLDGLPALANRLCATVIDALERASLESPRVRRFLVATHARAFEALLASVDKSAIREVTIIGGGLFPRSALVLARLLPAARFWLVDARPDHLALARAFLSKVAPESLPSMTFVAGPFEDASRAAADLLVVPLAYRGDRARFYKAPPARLVAVHDWIWRVRGRGTRVAFLLGKRINLVRQEARSEL